MATMAPRSHHNEAPSKIEAPIEDGNNAHTYAKRTFQQYAESELDS
jgi:hypothetical protein